MPIQDNPGLMGIVGGAVVMLLPKLFDWLTRGRAHARAATLKEIAERTSVMERIVQRLEAENVSLRKENDRCRTHNNTLDLYIDELEQVLRDHNIRLPTPPWARRNPK